MPATVRTASADLPGEIAAVIGRALQHPNAATLSNVQIARHLHMSEATLRRWRKKIAPAAPGDRERVVTRQGVTYQMKTRNIGHRPDKAAQKTVWSLRNDLGEMKVQASPNARRVLNVIGNWLFGAAKATVCLEAIEAAIGEWTRSTTTSRRVV